MFRTDRLGDALLTFPFVRSLQALAPSAELFYAVPEAWSNLFREQGENPRVLGLGGRFQQQAGLLASVEPDLILDPQSDPGMRTARLAFKSRARWRVGFSGYGRENLLTSYTPPPDKTCHFSQEAFKLLELWSYQPPPTFQPPFLKIPRDARSWWQDRRQGDRQLAKDYLCLHPGGFFSAQRWPLDRFVELSIRIRRELKQPVVWCWGRERKIGVMQSEDDLLERAGVVALSNLTAERLAAVIGKARLFVGNNSGPLHLACGLGTPTLSMLGPTFPERWWPLGAGHTVLRLGVACSPCLLGRCSHHTCLKGIDVERVFQSVCESTALRGGDGHKES